MNTADMPTESPPSKPRPVPISNARSASAGMIWVSIAMFFAKCLSFLSQIILGYVLAVETYAVFGLAATAVALTAGFQNSSVAKALIQSNQRFSELFPRYSAFAFQFGIIGTFVLIGIGAAFEHVYDMPQLFAVLVLTSLTIPFLSLNATLIAGLSRNYRFRDINLTDIKRSLIYYIVLVLAAVVGAEAFTMVIASLVGTLFAHGMLRRQSTLIPTYFMLRPKEFLGTLRTLRWVILSGFLIALAMRSDYFIVGKLLSAKELGYYTFGFMFLTSLTIPISAGINQVFLPVFARLQDNRTLMRREVIRFSSTIVILGALLCLLVIGVASVLINMLWGGKWDAARFVINTLAIAMPFRFLSTIAGVGLEALGRWRLRNSLLVLDAVILLVGAAGGVHLGGVYGAIIGVVIQRILSGVVSFAVLCRRIRLSGGEFVMLMFRVYTPFLAAGGVLFLLSPMRHGLNPDLWALFTAAGETLTALGLFTGMMFLWNRAIIIGAINLIWFRLRRRSKTPKPEEVTHE